MAIINVNCICGHKFKLDINMGLFTCPECKKMFFRYFDQKADTYKIVTGNKLKK